MKEKEHLKWLEEREQKLEQLEKIINNMQYDINDDQSIQNKIDIKMEIFKLWYFNRFEKFYKE